MSDADIKREMTRGNIVIVPFSEQQLQPNGYDVRIGPVYYTLNSGADTFYPFIEESVRQVFVRRVAQEKTIRAFGKTIRGRFIRIPPHGFAIASTLERVGTKKDVVALIRTRSSLARTGLCIVRGAGMGDIGYDGVWTLEVVSSLPYTYYLPVGLRVGQVIFMKTASPAKKPYTGKYLESGGPVLPKLYTDKDIHLLIKIEGEHVKMV